MHQEKPNLKVIREHIDSEDSEERLLRAFEMLLKDFPSDADPSSDSSK